MAWFIVNSSSVKYGVAKICDWTSGFGVMGEAGNYRVNPAEDSSSAGGLSSSMNLSSAASSSSRFMPSIPETGNENAFSPENGRLQGNEAAFPHDSWNETPFNSSKRNRDGDLKMFSNFNGLEDQVASHISLFVSSYCGLLLLLKSISNFRTEKLGKSRLV